jgi:hypothetical protein
MMRRRTGSASAMKARSRRLSALGSTIIVHRLVQLDA